MEDKINSPNSDMTLRSFCKQYGCTANGTGMEYSTRLSRSPRKSSLSSPNQKSTPSKLLFQHSHNHHHLHHHHHAEKASVDVSSQTRTTRTQEVKTVHFKLDEQNTKKSSASSSKRKSSNKEQRLTNHSSFSDYSSGYSDSELDSEKTDYTYSKSLSYSSAHSSRWRSPNMSRTRLRLKPFWSQSESFQGNNSYQRSSYGVDSDDSENEVLHYSHTVEETREISQSWITWIFYFIQRSYHYSMLSWYRVWRFVYEMISSVLLLDAYILSRCAALRRNKLLLLLPLLLLLLFLFRDQIYGGASQVYKNCLSWWSSQSSILSVDENLSIDQDQVTKIELDYTLPFSMPTLSFVWLTRLFSDHSSETAKQTSYTSAAEQKMQLNSQEIKILIQSIVKEEMTSWTNTMLKMQEKQKIEMAANAIKSSEIDGLQKQIKHISENLVEVKKSFQEYNSKFTSSEKSEQFLFQKCAFLKENFDQLHETIENQHLMLMKLQNCCKNQSEHYLMTQKLTREMGSHDSFMDWLKSVFVSSSDMDKLRLSMVQLVHRSINEKSVEHQTVVEELREAVSWRTGQTAYIPVKANCTENKNCASVVDVKRIVQEALNTYDADKIGKVDYALESSGGSVVSTRCSETYNLHPAQYHIFGIPFWTSTNSPRTVIQPDVHPGECWAFKGSAGYLVIKLSSSAIRPTAFTVEHIPKSLSPTGSIDSAPKDFSVWGLQHEYDKDGKLLGRFVFDQDGPSLQTFHVEDGINEIFPYVELQIHTNHGNLDYTCLYRFRVHGKYQ